MSEGMPVTNTGSFPTTSEPTILPKKPTDQFAGCKVFDITGDEYYKLMKREHKWDRWGKYFDTANPESVCHGVKQYLHRNPDRTVVLRNMTTQEMIYFKPKNKNKPVE